MILKRCFRSPGHAPSPPSPHPTGGSGAGPSCGRIFRRFLELLRHWASLVLPRLRVVYSVEEVAKQGRPGGALGPPGRGREAVYQFWINSEQIVDQCLAKSGTILDQCWAKVGPTFGQCSATLGPIWGQSWANFGAILDQVWTNFESMLDQVWTHVGPIWSQSGAYFGAKLR